MNCSCVKYKNETSEQKENGFYKHIPKFANSSKVAKQDQQPNKESQTLKKGANKGDTCKTWRLKKSFTLRKLSKSTTVFQVKTGNQLLPDDIIEAFFFFNIAISQHWPPSRSLNSQC